MTWNSITCYYFKHIYLLTNSLAQLSYYFQKLLQFLCRQFYSQASTNDGNMLLQFHFPHFYFIPFFPLIPFLCILRIVLNRSGDNGYFQVLNVLRLNFYPSLVLCCSQQKPEIKMRLYQQRHCPFDLKAQSKWDKMKAGCWTSWILHGRTESTWL